MIIAVEKFREMVLTDISDSELKTRLSALETAIRKYTNNHFIVRGTEREGIIREGNLILPSSIFMVGDTIEILTDQYENQPFTLTEISEDVHTVDGSLRFDGEVRAALVQYPNDVVMGIVNLMKWDISNREKMGVKSESISRWSVTYFDLESNSLLGYPASLLGFLKPYMRARF